MNLTVEQVAAATGARIDRAYAAVEHLNEAMALYAITTPARAAMFLANVGHETGGLKWYSELWSPTAQQKRYERDFSAAWPTCAMDAHRDSCARNRLAWELGNVAVGDGSRYRGHGMLQTTGRFNHAKVRDRLRARFPTLAVPDFEHDPTLLMLPRWAALAAADYVDMTGCNAMADAGDFDGYADLVNRGRKTAAEGDANGYDQRLALFQAVREGEALA
jgi:putative chitinase